MAESHFPAEQFRLTKAFSFPKQQFGSKGEEKSFCAKWCNTFSWLHYDVNADAALLPLRCEATCSHIAIIMQPES